MKDQEPRGTRTISLKDRFMKFVSKDARVKKWSTKRRKTRDPRGGTFLHATGNSLRDHILGGDRML